MFCQDLRDGEIEFDVMMSAHMAMPAVFPISGSTSFDIKNKKGESKTPLWPLRKRIN